MCVCVNLPVYVISSPVSFKLQYAYRRIYTQGLLATKECEVDACLLIQCTYCDFMCFTEKLDQKHTEHVQTREGQKCQTAADRIEICNAILST